MSEKSNIRPLLICVVGPTAIGKTRLGIEIAKALETEVISADSRQIYKNMAVGTAAPTPAEQAEVKHHFVEFLNPDELYSAGDFADGVLEFLEGYFTTNPVAVMVGGSGLYVRAVCEGLDNLPADLELRAELNKRCEEEGLEVLAAELRDLDPEHFKKMDSKNPQRVVRALEVCRCSGQPFSSFHSSGPAERPFDILKIGLKADRDIVNDRIARRAQLMIKAGWLEETRALLPYRDQNALNTVGYKELIEHLDGKFTLEEAIERIAITTRQFAKRQMTWFNKDKDIHWFDMSDADKALKFAFDERAKSSLTL